MTAALVLGGVEIIIAERILVRRLDLAIEPGEVLTVMGPSGSGKSTLLAFVAGFLDPAFVARGRVFLAGTEITKLPPERRRVGLLFQDDLLFPHLSVGENLAFGLAGSLRGRKSRSAVVASALADVGLEGFADRDPATLSGGQRARVTVLRSLLAQPRALLLDEPFSKLDSSLRGEFQTFLFAHVAERRLPTILVTHDKADADAARGPVVTIGT